MKFKQKLFFFIPIVFFSLSVVNAAEFKGDFKQGSFILGKVKSNSMVFIDKKKVKVTKDGFFAFGLGRDRKNNVIIKIEEDGKFKTIEKKVLKRMLPIKGIYIPLIIFVRYSGSFSIDILF